LTAGFSLSVADQPMETWDHPACGSVRWQSLFSGGATPTDSLTCGVAHVRAGDTFALHSHPPAEVYFCLSGYGTVSVAGQDFVLTPGTALFIPGGAVHGIQRAEADMSWFYVFATDRFEQVAYSFQTVQAVALQLPTTSL
jgi:quercetin dioxygenase-like cupin family protein